MALVILNFSLALFCISLAWRLGGEVERRGAQIMAAMYAIAVFGHRLLGHEYAAVDPVALLQDSLSFLGFSFLGIYSKRVWPLWAAALQLLSLGSHVIRALQIDVRPVVYAWMKSGPTWAVLVILLIGTLGHLRRTSLSGSARSSPG